MAQVVLRPSPVPAGRAPAVQLLLDVGLGLELRRGFRLGRALGRDRRRPGRRRGVPQRFADLGDGPAVSRLHVGEDARLVLLLDALELERVRVPTEHERLQVARVLEGEIVLLVLGVLDHLLGSRELDRARGPGVREPGEGHLSLLRLPGHRDDRDCLGDPPPELPDVGAVLEAVLDRLRDCCLDVSLVDEVLEEATLTILGGVTLAGGDLDRILLGRLLALIRLLRLFALGVLREHLPALPLEPEAGVDDGVLPPAEREVGRVGTLTLQDLALALVEARDGIHEVDRHRERRTPFFCVHLDRRQVLGVGAADDLVAELLERLVLRLLLLQFDPLAFVGVEHVADRLLAAAEPQVVQGAVGRGLDALDLLGASGVLDLELLHGLLRFRELRLGRLVLAAAECERGDDRRGDAEHDVLSHGPSPAVVGFIFSIPSSPLA